MELVNEKWSENLKNVRPKITHLYYKGDLDLLLNEAPKLAIVGSRRMTEYGQRVVDKWMPMMIQKGITIVSGFMYGVDQAAHKSCVENGGKTIAVLGWGIDKKVTAEDEKLYQKLVEVNSLIVSEYEGETAASRATFPQRNRIVAGIADVVLVVEAAEKSGSLITARLANKFGKKLLAVPGVVTSSVSEGTNNLIKNGRAKMVTSAEDVIEEMGLKKGQLGINFAENKDKYCSLTEVLKSGSKSVDDLSRVLKLPVTVIMGELFEMQLEGSVTEFEGKYKLTK